MGDGRDDVEVLAGVCRIPRGSLRSWALERRRIEPERIGQSYGYRISSCQNAPGTSSVSVSLSTPILHFSGFLRASPKSLMELAYGAPRCLSDLSNLLKRIRSPVPPSCCGSDPAGIRGSAIFSCVLPSTASEGIAFGAEGLPNVIYAFGCVGILLYVMSLREPSSLTCEEL